MRLCPKIAKYLQVLYNSANFAPLKRFNDLKMSGEKIKYTVFNIGSSLTLFYLTLLLNILMPPGALIAQNNLKTLSDTTFVLEELIISTSKPSPFQPLVRVVAVIRQKEIERAAVQNIQDLLRYVQGVDLRSRGSEGVQADLNILGGTFDQTMVMINGVNFTDPQTGHHSLNIPVDISQIDRIEVLHGPGAWSEGTVAYSGAINIITFKPQHNSLQATISAGEYGFFRGSVNKNFSAEGKTSGKWQISGQTGGGYNRSSGYSANTDFEIFNLYSNVNLKKLNGHTFELQAGFQEKAFGANSFYSVAYPDQYENTRLFMSSLKYQWERGRFRVGATLYQRRHHDRFELFRYQSADWYSGHNYHMSDIAGANIKAAFNFKKGGTTVIGSEYRYENIYSTVLGHLLNTGVKVKGEDGVEFTRAKSRRTPALYLRHILQLERWRFTAGIMAANTYNSLPETADTQLTRHLTTAESSYGTRLYAGVAVAYSINPYLEANGWINNSYRNPTFTDLYYKSPTQTGNTQLKPEEAIACQAGVNYSKANFKISLSAFFRHGYRIIDWTRQSGSDQWEASNLTNINSAGIDFNATLKIANDIINEACVSYSFIDVQKQSHGLHSLYATDFLRHKASLNTRFNVFSKLSGGLNLSCFKRAGTYLGPGGAEVPYRGFLLADIKLVWNGKILKPFIEATNLFNTEYLHIGNLPQPGRWIKTGVSIVL